MFSPPPRTRLCLVISCQALADRFVEAFAERLHADIRKDIWGYAPEETVRKRYIFDVES